VGKPDVADPAAVSQTFQENAIAIEDNDMGSAPAPEIKVKITGEDTGVSAAIKELGVQLQQLKRNQDDASGSARKLGDAEAGAGRSMREARESARLLSEETGVHLSRGLATIVSKSSLLGPLLNAAFPIAAAIGFGEVLASAAEKFSTLIASTFIYTDAMKSQYAAQVLANNEIAKSNEKIKELQKSYELIGLSGSARETVLAKRAKEDVDAAIKELNRLKAKQVELEQPSFTTGLLGAVLNQVGIQNSLGIPDVDAATATKQTQVTAQSKQVEEDTLKQRAAEKELADQKAEEAKTAAEKAKTLQDQISKARLAQLEAGFGYELALFKAQHSKEDQDNEANYEKGLESTATYYERKRALALAASQKEIDALTAERSRVAAAPTKDKAGEIERQTKLAELANKIAIAKVESEKTQQQLANEGASKQEEENRKALDWQAKIAAAQGLRFDEASERIAAEAIQMAADLKKAGIAPDQVDAMVSKFKAASTQQASFAGMKQGGQDATANLSAEEEDIRLKNIAVVAEAKIAELERSRLPILQALAAQMTAAAVGPQQIKEADDYQKSIDKLGESAKKTSADFTSFEDSATSAIKGDLTTFLGSTITQSKSVGDAFAHLAQSVVGSIQKIVAALLVQILTQKLVQAITGQDQSASTGVATAAAKGTAQAAPLIVAGTSLTTGGTAIGMAAIPLGASAAALQLAADTLIIANSMGGGAGMAGGGLITGPGTSTSDSISARLSTGEFVVRAAAVREIGVPELTRMNRGLHVPGIRGMSTPSFAEGGLVTHGTRSDGVDVNMNLGLDEGLILKHLSSKAAGKIVLTHVGNNPRAVSKALTRGT
jgi:hypothetical protein